MGDKDLPCHVRACPDSNGWNLDCFRDRLSDITWHTFNKDSEGSCLFRRLRIFDQVGQISLNPVTAVNVNVLRTQSNVGHDWDPRSNNGFDPFSLLGTALSLTA